MPKRFNPPPGWPPAPPGWTPPAGWHPPPHLPAPPPGWQLWIDETLAEPPGRRWRPSWRLYAVVAIVVLATATGLVAGAAGALALGGAAALLAGLVGLIRPRWVGT